MSYYKPSTSAIERSPLVPDRGPTIVCRTCGDTMKHFRTIFRTWSSAGTVHVPLSFLQRGRHKGTQAGGIRVPQSAPNSMNHV
jgi:hypothetical protein